MSSFDNSNSGFSNFGSNKYVSGTKEFLESNSIVAKFAFLLLVLILFLKNVLMNLYYFLNYLRLYI